MKDGLGSFWEVALVLGEFYKGVDVTKISIFGAF